MECRGTFNIFIIKNLKRDQGDYWRRRIFLKLPGHRGKWQLKIFLQLHLAELRSFTEDWPESQCFEMEYSCELF